MEELGPEGGTPDPEGVARDPRLGAVQAGEEEAQAGVEGQAHGTAAGRHGRETELGQAAVVAVGVEHGQVECVLVGRGQVVAPAIEGQRTGSRAGRERAAGDLGQLAQVGVAQGVGVHGAQRRVGDVGEAAVGVEGQRADIVQGARGRRGVEEAGDALDDVDLQRRAEPRRGPRPRARWPA